MLTLKLFDALTSSRKSNFKDRDLRAWANIEYKNDADFAFNYIKEHGFAPSVGGVTI